MLNNTKSRYWAFVAYPESLPDDWIDILQQTGLPFAVSPLHDKDFNADMQVKKAHYHVILCWDGPTTYKNVSSIVCDLLHQPAPIRLQSVRGYYRYFGHLDNPEKEPYDMNQIRVYNSFDPDEFNTPSQFEQDRVAKSILNIISSCHISTYRDLIDFLYEQQLDSEFRFARSNTLFLKSYLNSSSSKY